MILLRMSIVGLLWAAAALPQSCAVGDVRGTYLYQSVGLHSTGGSAAQVPARAFGLVQFDGSGQATGRLTLNVGGSSGPGTSAYDLSEFSMELSADCTGRIQYRLKPDGQAILGPDRLEIVVLDEGDRIWGQVAESPGRTLFMTAEFKRVGRGARACAQSMIRGTYLMRYEGSINMQTLNPTAASGFLPAFGNGIAFVDQDTGSLAGNGSHNWGGMTLHTLMRSGGFRVNSDCAGTFDYQAQVVETNGMMNASLPLIVTDNGDRMIVLHTTMPAFMYYERISIP